MYTQASDHLDILAHPGLVVFSLSGDTWVFLQISPGKEVAYTFVNLLKSAVSFSEESDFLILMLF